MIAISQIVSEFLDEINGGQAEYSRAYRIAVRVARELTYDVTGETVSIKLPINPNGTVTLPEDCIRVEKVGYVDCNGGIEGLFNDNNLTKGDKPTVFNNLCTTKYKIDSTTIYLEQGSDLCGGILIEYHSLNKINGETAVHPFASEAVIAGLRYRWHNLLRSVRWHDKEIYRADFKREKKLAKSRISQPTKQQLVQATRNRN